MKSACLPLAAALLCGCILAAQDLSLVEPGDILVLEFVPLKPAIIHSITKIVQVTSEGKIALPAIAGNKPRDLDAGGLTVNEVSEELQRSYIGSHREKAGYRYRRVIVERGTVAQLLGQ
ncbi:MAG: hypothetical protein ABSB35_21530 [Bryobacteraceae bacterium]|jgi:protein involved in polysaccharide export with SLBB domain